MKNIKILDCTLRDGAYITNGIFGIAAIGGIISKMEAAGVEIIECGWLKDAPYTEGSTYFHVPADCIPCLQNRDTSRTYSLMIDWNRYDVDRLPLCDGKSVDAIRVVFPHDRYKEGIAVAQKIKDKGYRVYLQSSNTLAYSEENLKALAIEVNNLNPEALSVVDTFGAMYPEDLERIVKILDSSLNDNIALGFHSHNNQQLSFALTIDFVKQMEESNRSCIVDASLCGMGRGAGNTTTELVADFLNKKYDKHYNMDAIMDAIDTYMESFQERYQWGYSTQYCIAGMYCCHVNNIAYLMKNHRTDAQDLRNIIESLPENKRTVYDYELLEEKYLEQVNRNIDDSAANTELREEFKSKNILLLCPGKSTVTMQETVKDCIEKTDPVVIGVNAIVSDYAYDYLFFTNAARYEYAKKTSLELFRQTKKILLSNIKTVPDENDVIVNYNHAIKRGWIHFDNAAVCCLRFLDYLGIEAVSIAGFDGFKTRYNESYADIFLPSLNPEGKWEELNEEIKSIMSDYKQTAKCCKTIHFVTPSIFDME